MPRKENTKAKTWERDRRTRMNAYFNSLGELLPPQQNGRKRNKMDILVHATKHIKDLHSRTEHLVQANASEAHKEEFTRLKKLVTQLFLRMQLLSNLLKDAGITVPAEPALEKISPLKWSNKINVNTVEKFLIYYARDKETEKKMDKAIEGATRKGSAGNNKSAKKDAIENQENCLNSGNDKKNESSEIEGESKETAPAATLATNEKSASDAKSAAGQKSSEKVKKTKKKRKVNEAHKIPPSTNAVGGIPTGTLLFSSAKIMPVVAPNIIMNAQSRPQASPIILNNAQQSQMFVVQPLQTSSPVRNSLISINAVQQDPVKFNPANMLLTSRSWASNVKTIVNSSKIGGRKGILPKGREMKTKKVYKVPIPAIRKEKPEKVPETKSKPPKSSGMETEKSVVTKKRRLSATAKNEPPEKKQKDAKESVEIASESVTCKSIENLKHVIEKIGESTEKAKENATKSSPIEEPCKETEPIPTVPENVEPSKTEEKAEPDKSEMTEIDKTKDETALEKAATNLGNEQEETVILPSEVCNLESGFVDTLLRSSADEEIVAESDKVLLNLDTNTTTTMKLESESASMLTKDSASKSLGLSKDDAELKGLSYSASNSFIPINSKPEATLHSDLSNDIFASLQVPSSSHNPESISPTVAFLTAFPLVSSLSGKTVVLEEEMKDDFNNHSQTPPMLLQIGNIEPNNFKIKSSSENPENSNPKVMSSVSSRCESKPMMKTMPKIVSNETVKEPFKIVQSCSNLKVPLNEENSVRTSVTKAVINEPPPIVSIASSEDYAESNNNNGDHKNEGDFRNIQKNVPHYNPIPESCQNNCQSECPKEDATVRNTHYDYQVCDISFENMRQDYNGKNTTHPVEQKGKMPSNPETFPSPKKIESVPFQQSLPYNEKEKQSKDSVSNMPEAGNNYQRNASEAQSSYVDPYGKAGKKIVPSSSANKSAASISNYSQQPEPFAITSSNYEDSAISRQQSTTTVAHNASNFSILSWTTFSPANNSNLAQFEHAEAVPQSKTICENFNYLPLKENMSNMVQPQSYVPESNRTKQTMEVQKQRPFDPAKNRNLRPIVSPQKQNRAQTQSEYNKYYGENKNKVKYSEMEYMQHNDFLNVDPRQQQSHQQQKSSSLLPVKQDKSSYMITDYDAQGNFESEQSNNPARYNPDVYVSSNFKSQHHQTHKYQSLIQAQHQQEQQQQQQANPNKPKVQAQQQQQHAVRPPVNWMMTPEIKHNPTANIGDIILPPIGKELEFCQNNFFSQTPTYNQSTPNQFYNNYEVTAAHGFPNIPGLQSEPKRASEATFYPEEQTFSWSPTKNMPQSVEQNQSLKSTVDQHVVQSTLPTLVGDLALGTNHLPERQNFLLGQIRPTGSDINKDLSKEMLNSQNSTQGMSSFLSVSQLVEQEKAEKQQHQQHQQQQHHHHHHHQQQQQPHLQQQQQPRKHQRKSNASPRGSSKKHIDIRKQVAHHEEQKSSNAAGFQEQQSYQQQNEAQWRGRNCKSNYTAEALIGNEEKNPKYNYSQNKFPGSLHSSETMMPINYFPNVDNGGGYGQVVNQNFNHSYAYSSNANIYPTSNFITSISNTPTNYMMSLHENPDYLETNNFLLAPNVATTSKGHQHFAAAPKHPQSCENKRYATPKKSKRKVEGAQNLEFPISGITSPLDDYHHATTFLAPPPHANSLYQNHGQGNVYPKPVNSLALPASTPASGNSMAMTHHPSGTSLTNFNLTTIFPEMNDKVPGYKSSSNGIQSGLVQSSSHVSTSYPQRVCYTNSLGHVPQVSESSHFSSNLPRPSTSDVGLYKSP